MNKGRKRSDSIRNILTYTASSFSLIILISILSFIFINGKDTLSIDMIKNNYWSENYLVTFVNDKTNIKFDLNFDLKNNQAFSYKYGVVLEDTISHEGIKQLTLINIDKDSPFNKTVNLTAGPTQDHLLTVSKNDNIEKMVLINSDGSKNKIGMIYETSAKNAAFALDNSEKIESLFFKTPGGGIWGSLLATLQLIGISLLIALPLGTFTAIYLNEIAKKGKIASLVEYSIELLAGVPSIIFGLMGVIVLYPITSFFNIEGLSILLGGLTMSVVLLPVVIRSVQEALKTVPNGLRMASLSLGASKTQTIFKIILPSAIPGILSALLLAISRIIGESAALIYTMGTFINDSPKISQGATTLAVHIWSIMSQEQPNFELASAISIIILLMVLVLNLSVKLISKRFSRKLGH